jgi:hypothetical protein
MRIVCRDPSQYLLKDLYCVSHQVGAEGIKKPLVVCRLPSLGLAEVIAEQFPADQGIVTGLEPRRKLLRQLIGLFSRRLVFGLRHTIFKTDGHKGSGYGTAGLAHARHPPAKGTGNPKGKLARETELLSETGEHCLRSRKPFTKTTDCLLYRAHL